ncbi:hypothetical protein NCPPB3778_9 [Rathayibacter phage NCPPB3778]|nr:hypothetical protein NCPPB3778_9 [Rathayibacter phage NCPPB3778]
MFFPSGVSVYRVRPAQIVDPYSGESSGIDWDNADWISIPDSFIAQSSTSLLATSTREQASESKSLFCDGAADVKKGDRIMVQDHNGQWIMYTIDGIPPEADRNPWTGWTPPREITLKRAVG